MSITATTATDHHAVYHAKLTDAVTAVQAVASGSSVAIGQAACQPRGLLQALADRARRAEIDRVRLFYFHAEKPMADTVLHYDLMGRFLPHSMFLQPAERDLIRHGERDGRKVVYFIPTSFSQSVRVFAESIPVDTCLVTVSPMDEHGYFTFGTNNDYTSSVARQARALIVEVNPNMPRVFGASTLHVSEVAAITENDVALPELPQRPITELDRAIGGHVAALVPDRACVQIGVGGLPQAVCEALRDRTDLGIHSEVFTPALADLVACGVATGRYKSINRGKAVFTFAMGDRGLYDFMNDNVALESHPVNYVNDPTVIARNDNAVSINSTVEMDLTGACNSEHVNGHQYSAAGGQLDFVRGAYASRGGISVIAFASTTRRQTISKVVPRLSGPVTTPRTDTHYVATEYGAVNLKGLSSSQRAEALIGLAHPDYRDWLTDHARQMHLI
ncbi:4-hydroxybutyrate:acetyl-CoA CoA transferase [Mycobacterium lepraemurium]|nr:acetyl-CoA hydrolase/transferase C-terminal domain-containing protein [Mycobacterium lepraemurium]ATA28929.1 4-hydroxybutyrate:acetyl-CoA CoA transferase [Mycobacterium lepraemurium]